MKLENGEYIEYPLFNIYIGNIEEYLDHNIVHELNHAYELTFKSMENNVCTLHCGWDILRDTISSQSQETVSLDEKKEKRDYELFNEIINELIAQEISEIMSQMGIYVFNTKEDKKIVGLIMGIIPEYGKYDYLDYKCPKRGMITELIVTKKVQSKGIGQSLINHIEDYFKSQKCKYVLVDVFAYNKTAINFYDKSGYHPRMYTDIKKLK